MAFQMARLGFDLALGNVTLPGWEAGQQVRIIREAAEWRWPPDRGQPGPVGPAALVESVDGERLWVPAEALERYDCDLKVR